MDSITDDDIVQKDNHLRVCLESSVGGSSLNLLTRRKLRWPGDETTGSFLIGPVGMTSLFKSEFFGKRHPSDIEEKV